MTPEAPWNLARARALDAEDHLGAARARFALPHGTIYMNGNSLGPLATGVAARVRETVEASWGAALSRGWSELGWMDAPERVGDRIAALIGALPGEVLVADTTTVALAKLVGAALAARPTRHVILSSTDNFPSDLYAALGAAQRSGALVRVVDRSELLGALNEQVAVCCLTQVDFRTGALHDLPGVTEAAHRVGALALWDLCHSAGVVRVDLEANDVDLAVGCTYKYLNGGPGSPSFLYVRRRHQATLENPLPGWLGHAEPFRFDPEWHPAPGIRRFLTSTPPVLALAALDAALDAFEGCSIEQIRAKSEVLGALFAGVVAEARVASLELASPASASERGAQITLRHPRAPDLLGAVAERGVIGDLRPPELCRFGLSPLTLSFEDAFWGATAVVEAARTLA